MQEITRNQLQEKIESGSQFALLEVLAPEEYEKGHIPQAINVPLNDEFDQSVTRAIPKKDKPVVVYCASETCEASPKAAKRLEELGYENVMDYTGGKKDWSEAGLRLESTGN